MIPLLLALSVAVAEEPPDRPAAAVTAPAPFVPSGLRVSPLGGTHGVSVASTAVVGRSGGTQVTSVAARFATPDFSVSVRMPLAAYRAHGGRHTDLGNLFVEGLYTFGEGGGVRHGLGVEAHFSPGGEAYTWLHRAEEIWPGTGANLVYQLHAPAAQGLEFMVRGIVGLHGAHDYEPYPGLFAQIGAAGLVDWTLPVASQVGLVGEMAVTYWDLSPWELTALVRFDPVRGMRLRGGALLPMASWLGWTPSQLDRGLDELTLHVDAQMAF